MDIKGPLIISNRIFRLFLVNWRAEVSEERRRGKEKYERRRSRGGGGSRCRSARGDPTRKCEEGHGESLKLFLDAEKQSLGEHSLYDLSLHTLVTKMTSGFRSAAIDVDSPPQISKKREDSPRT
jgi:hypothetical protein